MRSSICYIYIMRKCDEMSRGAKLILPRDIVTCDKKIKMYGDIPIERGACVTKCAKIMTHGGYIPRAP